MPLAKDQNAEECIKLLVGQRQIYNSAKIIRRFRVYFVIVVSVLFPAILLFYPAIKLQLSAISGCILIINFLLKGFENSKIKKAAIIQEEFDVLIFGLPWNKVMVGNKVSKEDIIEANRKFSVDRGKLNNWYSINDDIYYPLNVLVCQRTNLSWDYRLKIRYSILLFAITLLYFILGITYAIFIEMTVLDYALLIFLPAVSSFVLGIDTGRNHLTLSNEKKKKVHELNDLIDTLINQKKDEQWIIEKCRQYQDVIFHSRCKDAIVPNLFYKLLRRKFEDEMKETVNDYANTIKANG